MKLDGPGFPLAIISLLLIMTVGIKTTGVDSLAEESHLHDDIHGIRGYSAHSRIKRAKIAALLAMGRKALRELKKDSVPDPASDKSLHVFVKHGSFERAEKDFWSVNPSVKRTGTFINGVEYKIGEVGDKVITLLKDKRKGNAVIEVQRKQQYSIGPAADLVTEIIYKD